MNEPPQRPRVAVVGSGVAGLAATWSLNEHSNAEVHLFEADNRPGGHANTVRFKRPGTNEEVQGIDVDTYPNFLRFLALPDVKVPVVPTEMTFSVSRDKGDFEWAGKDPAALFCQIQNLFQPGMWRMVWDILRFNASARRLIEESSESSSNTKTELSIGDYLTQEGYSNEFVDDYLIPMTAAIWSTPPDTCALDFPARTLIRFMHNHHLLQIIGKPKWLTIPGGSHKYVNRILDKLPKPQLHLSTPVQSISTSPGSSKVQIKLPSGTEEFDHVILATHSDTSLRILRQGTGVTADEEEILESFLWSKNRAVLHSDVDLMPKRRAAWSCWNYLTFSEINAQGEKRANVNEALSEPVRMPSIMISTDLVPAFLTPALGSNVSLVSIDCMNHLQHIDENYHGPVLVTLNPPFEPRPELVIDQSLYEHPVMSAQSIAAQAQLPKIQNIRGISYAGFHEDGFTSGLRAATSISIPGLKIKLPFSIASPDRASGSVIIRNLGENIFGTLESIRYMMSIVIWWALGATGAADTPKQKIKLQSVNCFNDIGLIITRVLHFLAMGARLPQTPTFE
ncbi:Flavin containing amine oxidoreductase [Rhizoctonia solani]|uniref:Flavin containing amine oxidoreductase n=1 Tax=Rhizoctonia solani TaxID=456999 RepID=A0A8H7HEU8_9AGAM|nr:Flavin containing amine oxidoreductase [Rhizoctonia solani]